MTPTSGKVQPPAKDGPMRQLVKDLDVPPEVIEAIELTCKLCRVRSRRERAQVEEQLKLRYYYGGKGVLSLRTSQGIVIVSVVEPDGDNFRGVPLRETLAGLTADERRCTNFQLS